MDDTQCGFRCCRSTTEQISLFSKFFRNTGSMQKKYRHVLSTSGKYGKYSDRFLVKSSVGIYWCLLLVVK